MANLSPASNSKTNGVLELLQLQDSVAILDQAFAVVRAEVSQDPLYRFVCASPAMAELVVLVDEIVMNTFGNADKPPTNKTAVLLNVSGSSFSGGSSDP